MGSSDRQDEINELTMPHNLAVEFHSFISYVTKQRVGAQKECEAAMELREGYLLLILKQTTLSQFNTLA